jgi:cell division transport system permease protein
MLASLSLAAGLFVAGAGLLGIGTLDRWVAQMQSLARMTVFASEGTKIEALEHTLRLDPRFTSIRRISSAEATKQFMEYVRDAGLMLDTLGSDAVPDNLALTLRDDRLDRKKAIEVGQGLRAVKGVGDVVVDHERLDTLLNGARALRNALAGFGALLLLVAAFSTGTVVRMSIAAREEEINIMRLVGATEFFILMPLLVEGSVLGLLAALTATGALWVIWLPFALGQINISPFVMEILKLASFSTKNLTILSAAGLATGAIGAWMGFHGSVKQKRAEERMAQES